MARHLRRQRNTTMETPSLAGRYVNFEKSWCCQQPEEGDQTIPSTSTLMGIRKVQFEAGKDVLKREVAALVGAAASDVKTVEVRELQQRAAGVEVNYEVEGPDGEGARRSEDEQTVEISDGLSGC